MYIVRLTLIISIFILISCKADSDISDIVQDNMIEYHINCNKSDLDKIYNEWENRDLYIPISISYNGQTISNAKMRLRGDTSREYDKKSLKIVLGKNQTINGLRKINLNSEWTDKSYIRQYLSSLIFNKSGIPTFKSNFVNLYINDKFFGLYLQVENVDEEFLSIRNIDKNGNLYKATKDGACLSMFEYDNPQIKWEKKTNKKDTTFSDLKELIFNINNVPDYEFQNFIKLNFDYDKLITYLAVNMLIQNGSTYYHNYYMFHDINGTGKWELFPWDLDKTMSYYSWKPYKFHETSSNWESDNPLIERILLNKQILNDLKNKVAELNSNIFNSDFLFPIIDKVELLLQKSVEQDTTDKIEKIEDWKKVLSIEKEFILNQTNLIIDQLNTLPSGFTLLYQNKKYTASPKLFWTSCTSSDKKKIKYTLFYGKHFLLEDSNTIKIENISDTTFQINDKLEKGIYYWRVIANDGNNSIEGFNTKSTFEIVTINNILQDINENMVLDKSNSPYFVTKDINVSENAILTVEAGVEIIFSTNANIFVSGDINMLGSKYSPIFLMPEENEWGSIYIVSKTGKSKFKYVNFINGAFRSKFEDVEMNHIYFDGRNKTLVNGEDRQSLIWINYGKFFLSNSYIIGSGLGEGMNINYAETQVDNSYFKNFPDAIELIDVSKGIVRNNIVINSPDDAIDMNGCSNIIIENNLLLNNRDKAVSIGTEQYGPSTNIIVRNNLIHKNNISVSIKDSSFAHFVGNILIGNNIDLDAKIKNNWKIYDIGGNLSVDSCYFINTSKQLIRIDEKSKIVVSNSISNKMLIPGEGNTISKDEDIETVVKRKFKDVSFGVYKMLDFYQY